MKRVPIVLAAAIVVAGCAPLSAPTSADRAAAPDGTRACFLPQSLTNFRAEDDTLVYVRTGRSEVYEIRAGVCLGLDAALSLSVRELGGSAGRACVGDIVDLGIAGPSSASRSRLPCRAEVTRRLTVAEVAALPSRLRP